MIEKRVPGAKRLIQDPERIAKLARDSLSLIRGKKTFSDVQSEAMLLVYMVRDVLGGRYKGLSKKNLLTIVAGLLYLVNPLDLLPDFIFAIGFADDLGVLAYIISKLSEEIGAYRRWKKGISSGDGIDLEGLTLIDEDI